MNAHVKGKFIADRFCFVDFQFTEFLQNLILVIGLLYVDFYTCDQTVRFRNRLATDVVGHYRQQ